MTDTARVLLTAAALSATALAAFAWRLRHLEPRSAERLIGELRLGQWGAILLAGTGAAYLGLAVAAENVPGAHLDATIAIGFIGLAGFILLREPREAVTITAIAFIAHALLDIAHRPGFLPPDIVPRWYSVGCATYDVYVAAVCYWCTRRQDDTTP